MGLARTSTGTDAPATETRHVEEPQRRAIEGLSDHRQTCWAMWRRFLPNDDVLRLSLIALATATLGVLIWTAMSSN